MLFVGAFERQLDDKGRLALPAPFRSHLGEQCYLTLGQDKCVNVTPVATFEEMALELMAQVKRGELSQNRQRAVAANAVLVNVDKQGRVNIDDKLRTYAEISPLDKVVVSGNLDRIEIWSPERYARISAEGTDDLAGPA